MIQAKNIGSVDPFLLNRVLDFVNNDDDKILTKFELKQNRIMQNKQWKMNNKSDDNEFDPNPRHTSYYKTQIPYLQDEWNEFRAALTKELPVTFRLSAYRHKFINHIINHKLLHEYNLVKRGTANTNIQSNVVTQTPWNNNAWQINIPKSSFSTSSGLSTLYNDIKRDEKLGYVVRQELVSMLPVLFLDVQSHHKVLDMCAAPGSKTEQILDMLHKNMDSQGMLVANDANPRRLTTLRQRYSRSRSPCLVLTCSSAEELAAGMTIRTVRRLGDGDRDRVRDSDRHHSTTEVPGIAFDRILCDVPCSGDGTFRKQPHLWRLFRPRTGLELHSLQLSILSSAVSLLHRDGRLVYSTCSLNPLENEAVISGILQKHSDLKLVNIRNILSDTEIHSVFIKENCNNSSKSNNNIVSGSQSSAALIVRPGLTYWESSANVITAGETVEERKETLSKLPSPLADTLHPPCISGSACAVGSTGSTDMHLEYCVRLYPQDQDTGGFFVAILEYSNDQDAAGTTRTAKAATSSDSRYDNDTSASNPTPHTSTSIIRPISNSTKKLRTNFSQEKNRKRKRAVKFDYNSWKNDVSPDSYVPYSTGNGNGNAAGFSVRSGKLFLAADCKSNNSNSSTSSSTGNNNASLAKKSKKNELRFLKNTKLGDNDGINDDKNFQDYVKLTLVSDSVSEAMKLWENHFVVQMGVTVAALTQQNLTTENSLKLIDSPFVWDRDVDSSVLPFMNHDNTVKWVAAADFLEVISLTIEQHQQRYSSDEQSAISPTDDINGGISVTFTDSLFEKNNNVLSSNFLLFLKEVSENSNILLATKITNGSNNSSNNSSNKSSNNSSNKSSNSSLRVSHTTTNTNDTNNIFPILRKSEASTPSTPSVSTPAVPRRRLSKAEKKRLRLNPSAKPDITSEISNSHHSHNNNNNNNNNNNTTTTFGNVNPDYSNPNLTVTTPDPYTSRGIFQTSMAKSNPLPIVVAVNSGIISSTSPSDDEHTIGNLCIAITKTNFKSQSSPSRLVASGEGEGLIADQGVGGRGGGGEGVGRSGDMDGVRITVHTAVDRLKSYFTALNYFYHKM